MYIYIYIYINKQAGVCQERGRDARAAARHLRARDRLGRA